MDHHRIQTILFEIAEDENANPYARANIVQNIWPEFGFRQHKLFNIMLDELDTLKLTTEPEHWRSLPTSPQLAAAIEDVRDIEGLRAVSYALCYVRERLGTLRSDDMDYISVRFNGHHGWML